MIVSNMAFDIVEECDETCYLISIIPYSIQIQLYNANITLGNLGKNENDDPFIETLINENRIYQEARKIQALNQFNDSNYLPWIAGTTSVSKLTYSEKENLFGNKYNLLGFDYYTGGIFIPRHLENYDKDNSLLVKKFDWREKHNAHLQYHPYFDGNPDYFPRCNNAPIHELGNGWMTKVEDQHHYEPPYCNDPCTCNGTCFIFGPLGTMEAVTNLYFNHHYNMDLSEQYAFNCSSFCSCDGGGVSYEIFDEAVDEEGEINEGIIDELSLPWEDDKLECDKDLEFEYRLTINDYEQAGSHSNIPPTEELKENLILHGPLQVVIDLPDQSSDHSLVLVGYGVLEAGDIFHTRWGDIIEIDDYPRLIGSQYWICKNSYSPESGDQGYYYLINNSSSEYFYQICHYTYIVPPVYIETNGSSFERHCYDRDNDGYYNWGLGEFDPLLCDQICENLNEDSNDDNDTIGPYDDFYNGKRIKPEMQVYLLPRQSVTGKYFLNNSFFSFSDDDLRDGEYLHFYVENSGDAQLNLRPWGWGLNGERPVEIIEIEGGSPDFSIDDPGQPQSEVCMDSSTLFKIKFTGSVQGELTKIKIYLDENGEIPDFEFILVYNDCQPEQGVTEITGNQYWDSFMVKTNDYLILPQATLTVTGEVAMGINSDIFVAPDGKLIIDGGRLTSACSGLWNGIDVWGDARMYQTSRYQGMVEIKNGGMIENADTAIATVRLLNLYQFPSGGIVSCKDAVFKDNTYDVVFYPYTNTLPVPPYPIIGNASRFNRTRFETTDDYYEITHSIAEAHLKMNEVGGIRIAGCTFINSSTQKDYSRGIGIESNNAGYTINNFCSEDIIPCPGEQPCTFENLDYGIRAFNTNSLFAITVDSADFIDNYLGISMSIVNDASIIKNHFYLNADDQYFNPSDILVGIYTERCTRYQIEENKITGLDRNNFTLIGMHLLNSLPEYNEIYNDSLINLNYGIIASGENRDEDGKGLCIKCNAFVDCNLDVAIIPDGGESPKRLGIAFKQGDIAPEPPPGQDPDQTVSAGNTFSTYYSTEINYSNNIDCNPIQYTYHGQNPGEYKIKPEPTEPPQPSNQLIISPDNAVTFVKATSCPSNLSGGGITLSMEKSKLSNEIILIDAYSDTLAMFVDGGNTGILQYEVQTSLPDEALIIRQQLIDQSPYLSDTVMITAIEKEDVLPNVMIRDILTANPQSAKNEDVLNHLVERQVPMPEYMIDEIKQNESVYGPKEFLEQKIVDHSSRRDISIAKLSRFYKTDTISPASSHDSLESMLYNLEYPESYFELLFQYLNEGDSATLYSTINNIPVLFDLDPAQSNELELYEELFNILFDIQKDTLVYDTAGISSLYNLYINDISIPSVFSRNYLIYNHYISYDEPVYLPLILKTFPIIKPPSTLAKSNNLIRVFPNPAGSYFILDYNIPDNLSLGTKIIITDIQGRNLWQVDIDDDQNQLIIPVTDLTNGVYLVQLIIGNQLKESIKVTVLK